jgi:hypothetical protein
MKHVINVQDKEPYLDPRSLRDMSLQVFFMLPDNLEKSL